MDRSGNGNQAAGDPGRAVDEEAESLLFECVDRLNAGETIDLAALRRERPAIADLVIEQLRAFEGLDDDGAGVLGTLGDYTLRRELGRGGMGVVYEAWQASMGRPVALKVLPAGLAADRRAVTRFVREAQVAGNLVHPNVVAVYGMGIEAKTPYFAMELVDGETLARLIARWKEAGGASAPTPFGRRDEGIVFYGRLAAAFAGVAEGLQHAHAKGVVHRDIKPSNLILDRAQTLRILDFGLARLEGQETLTVPGDVLGTLLYMSPEQARRRQVRVDHRTDVYSLGATLYEVLALEPPFRGRDDAETLSQIIEREPVPPSRRRPGAPRDLETIVLKCLRKDPVDRYATAEALAQDLRRFVRADPIEARPLSGLERLSRRLARNRRSIARSALVGVLALACALLGSLEWRAAARRKLADYQQAVVHLKLKVLRGRTTMEAEEGASALDRVSFFGPGDLARLAGDPIEEAVGALRVLAQALPERFEAHYYLAQGLLLLGERDEARDRLERVLRIRDDFIPARVLAEEIEEPASRFPRSRAWLEARGDARWQELWLEAHVAARDGHTDAAERAYAELIALDRGGELYAGSTIDLRLGRAFVRLDAGRPELALGDLEAVRDRWPGLLEPALFLGTVYHRLGLAEAARDAFESLYRQTDSKAEAAAWIAVVHISLGDYQGSLEWAGRIEGEGLKSLGARLRAISHGFRNERAEARRAVEEALALDPEDSVALFLLATQADAKKGFRNDGGETAEDVIRRCEAVIRLRPGFPAAYALLAKALQEKGDTRAAVEACHRAIEIDPSAWQVIRLAPTVLLAEGRIDEIRDFIGRLAPVLDDLPLRSKAFVLGWRGYLLTVDGNLPAARAACEEAWELHREFWLARNIGELFFRQGEYARAVDAFRSATALPGTRNFVDDVFEMIAASCDRLGKPADGLRAFCEALRTDPRDASNHRRIVRYLRRHGELALEGSAVSELRDLVDGLDAHLETCASDDRDATDILRTLAFLRLHVPELRDLPRAMELAGRAVELSERRDPEALAILAEALAISGEARGAVGALEEALRSPGATVAHRRLLEEARRGVFPDLVSFASVDAALEERDPAADGDLINAFDGAASGPHVEACRAYLEARALERRGEPGKAAEVYERLIARGADGVEVRLRLAASLRAAGDAPAAEKRLREALAGPGPGARELWDAWVALSLDDLGLEPRAVLDRMPAPTGAATGEGGAYAGDIRWLLAELDAGRLLRIHSGGGDHVSPSGEVWGQDRFFLGGSRRSGTKRIVEGTEDLELYQNHRKFDEEEDARGYRLPLPRGVYEVTVHFLEERLVECPEDAVELRIEGRKALDLEGCMWWLVKFAPAVARTRSFEVAVEDGALDLEFAGEGTARIAAIEVRPSG
jgi:serine/threonine protein kinase/cytochrome c-type biogenesis protein CcmH/NrfG